MNKIFNRFVGILGPGDYRPIFTTKDFDDYESCKKEIIQEYHDLNKSDKYNCIEVYILCYNDELRLTKTFDEWEKYEEVKTYECEDLILETLKYTDYVSIKIDPYDGIECIPNFNIGDNAFNLSRKISDFEDKPNKFNIGDMVKLVENPEAGEDIGERGTPDTVFVVVGVPTSLRDPESLMLRWERAYHVIGVSTNKHKDINPEYYYRYNKDIEADRIHEDNLELIMTKDFNGYELYKHEEDYIYD